MADDVLVHEEERGIHRLVMNNGPNALDSELMSALREQLRQLDDAGAPAVVLGWVWWCPAGGGRCGSAAAVATS